MKKLRCTSCGAELKIEENKEYAICEHCGSKYKMNEDLNINIKMDDNLKEVINNGTKSFSKIMLIPIVLFVIIFISIIFFAFKSKSDFTKNVEENSQQNDNPGNELIDKFHDEAEKRNFNFHFSSATGTKSGFFLTDILDKINVSNKTNDRKITLVFDGKVTTDETEIINIKHGLKDRDMYEVMVNYDSDGYVNEIKVDRIN